MQRERPIRHRKSETDVRAGRFHSSPPSPAASRNRGEAVIKQETEKVVVDGPDPVARPAVRAALLTDATGPRYHAPPCSSASRPCPRGAFPGSLAPREPSSRESFLVFAFLMGHRHAAFLGRDAGEDHPRTATRHWPVHGAQHDDTGHSRCASRRGCSAVIPPDPERRLTEPPLKKRVSAEPKSPVVVVVRRPRRTKSLTRFSCCFFLLPQRLLPRRRPPPAPEGEDPDFGRRVRRHSGRRVEGSRRRPKPNGDGTRRRRARARAAFASRSARTAPRRSIGGWRRSRDAKRRAT